MPPLDETEHEDQGLNFVAFYPSEACLAKMFYVAGFPHVYRFRCLPKHPHYVPDQAGHRTRTMLAASLLPLPEDLLIPLSEPISSVRPWEPPHKADAPLERIARFMNKPWSEQLATVKRIAGGKPTE